MVCGNKSYTTNLIKNLKDKEKTALKSGDIIAFMSANTDSWGKTITHMIDSPKYNEQTGKLVRDAGANNLVAGSYVFKANNRKEAIDSLR